MTVKVPGDPDFFLAECYGPDWRVPNPFDTGSRMDEVIFKEFKGTGNSEIIPYWRHSDKRSVPAIDITKSGTREEELLVERSVLSKMWLLRRMLNPMWTVDAMEFLLDKLKCSKTNNDFFDAMNN